MKVLVVTHLLQHLFLLDLLILAFIVNVTISHWDFKVHFPVKHLTVCLTYIFGEMSIQIFCPLFILIFLIELCVLCELLYVKYIQTNDLQIFSPSLRLAFFFFLFFQLQ